MTAFRTQILAFADLLNAVLSGRSLEILPVLEKRGVRVSRSVTRIRRVEELYE